MKFIKTNILFSVIFCLCPLFVVNAQFVHPGILHAREDLERIKEKTSKQEEPWKSGYDLFLQDSRASYKYKMQGPFKIIGRGTHPTALPKKEVDDDCMAAYYNALQWTITGNKLHADKAIEILNGYAYNCKEITGRDKQLMGLNAFIFVNAAEILAHTSSGWKEKDIEQCRKWLRDVYYPVLMDYATFANGNWDLACMKAIIGIGVFLDDKEIFNHAVNYFSQGEGNGRLTHYLINENGQCQESGRDQSHTQLGIGCLAEVCEVAYKQGLDLYKEFNYRLLKGYEYTAKYNLGYDVPFQEYTDKTGKYHHLKLADHDRGKFRGVYEIAYNHYVERKKMAMPYTEQVIKKTRPEGIPWTADHSGYGTLLFALSSGQSAPVSFQPGAIWPDEQGVHINAHGGGILLYNDTYYWFGEHKTAGKGGNVAVVGTHCYSSKDLYNWKDEGIPLSVAPEGSGSDIESGCVLERPKVIYNAKTKKFVMYFHLELKGKGYSAARTGIAVSDKITGPYQFLKSLRPNAGIWPVNLTEAQRTSTVTSNDVKDFTSSEKDDAIIEGLYVRRDFQTGQMSRDMTLYVDDDQKAYHIYASEENKTLQIAELTDDYLDYTGKYYRIDPAGWNEAPALFKRNGKYFMITSGCTGWRSNPARVLTADKIVGPWTRHPDNPAIGQDAETTFHSQSTFILPAPGKKDTFIFMADRWIPDNAIDGRYIWLPIMFENGLPVLKWFDQWDLNTFDALFSPLKGEQQTKSPSGI
ncbi:hypothetical protein EZS27_011395 [termite gut metagenome]|uniref:Alginate lyase domain-containing protein n=1 Tax=termite gut metagenome TaxID=433724 RepID=A0A5J4S5W2_9ZZZZ